MVRGVLTGRRRFAAVGAGLVAENGVRCLGALALWLAGVDNPVAYGLCLLAGYAAAAAWPSTFRLGAHRDRRRRRVAAGLPRRDRRAPRSSARRSSPAARSCWSLAGGTATEVTALFAGLALFRAPYTLALGLVAQLTGWLTRLVVAERDEELRRVRRGIVLLTVVGSAGAAAGGRAGRAVAAAAGLRRATSRSRPSLTLLLAVASTVAMANLVVTLLVIAHGRALALARWWAVALVPGVVWFVLAAGAGARPDLLGVPRWSRWSAFGLLLREGRARWRARRPPPPRAEPAEPARAGVRQRAGFSAARKTDDPNGRSTPAQQPRLGRRQAR